MEFVCRFCMKLNLNLLRCASLNLTLSIYAFIGEFTSGLFRASIL